MKQTNLVKELCKTSQILFFVSFVFFFLGHLGHASATQKDTQEYDEVVSLGFSCQTAGQMEANGIRKRAYPFDWLLTPFNGLLSFIANKGTGFLSLDKLKIQKIIPVSGAPSALHVMDLTYGFISRHDFLGNDLLNSYAVVKDKYDRRIQRLFKLLNSSRRVLFIRSEISKEEAKRLDQLLTKLYPKLSYTIVAVSESENAKLDWNLPRIRNFYHKQVKKTPNDWQGDSTVWKAILQQFSVKPLTEPRPADERW